MALGINTNVASLSAQNQLQKSQNLSNQALERLSSGLRINSAKDDAAGLAISTRFSAQISGLDVAQRNANDGISYAQTAEGALGEITSALSRIRDLSVQSANDTNNSSDRAALDQEVDALIKEVERIAQSTQFNGQNILDGNLSDLTFQVGANAGQTISVSGVDSRSTKLGSTVMEGLAITDFDATTTQGQALTIESKTVDLSSVTSIDEVVQEINKISGTTNVRATREDSVSVTYASGDLSLPSGANGTLTINGEDITVADGATINDLAQAINDKGLEVSASVVSGDLKLESQAESFTVTGGADDILGTGAAQVRYDAGIRLTSQVDNGDFQVAGTAAAAGALNLQSAVETNKLSTLTVATRTDASAAIETVDFALDQVNSLRAELGAVQSRFESTISNLASTSENLSAANSRILDADFAAETAKLSKAQVLQQAGISVLAQANARPQQVLSLLQ